MCGGGGRGNIDLRTLHQQQQQALLCNFSVLACVKWGLRALLGWIFAAYVDGSTEPALLGPQPLAVSLVYVCGVWGGGIFANHGGRGVSWLSWIVAVVLW